MSVGQDLLNVPFPQMIFSMAQAIAKGQLALDKSSIETLKVLAKTEFDWIPEITEVLYPKPIPMTGPKGQGAGVPVTGVGVELQEPQPTKMTLLQAGINPTFHQFTDSIIEVKMSISSTTSSENSLGVGVDVSASVDFFFGSATVSSHVNYHTANKYSYSVEGSSLLRTELKPAPPPPRLMPTMILVDATDPAHVKITKS
jgi:hypothetical protein